MVADQVAQLGKSIREFMHGRAEQGIGSCGRKSDTDTEMAPGLAEYDRAVMHSGHWEAELAADFLDRGHANRRHEVQQNAYPAEGHQTALRGQRHVHLPPGIPKDIVGKPRWRTPVHNLAVHGLRRVPAYPDLPVIHALIVSSDGKRFRRRWEIAMDPLSSTRRAAPRVSRPHPALRTRHARDGEPELGGVEGLYEIETLPLRWTTTR